MSYIIDILFVGIIVLCVWRGISKGIILSAAGLITLVLALFCAQFVADNYSDVFVDSMAPFASGIVEEAANEEYFGFELNTETDDDTILEVAESVFLRLGMSDEVARTQAEKASEGISSIGADLKDSISNSYISMLSYVLTFVIVFVLLNIIFSVILNLANIVFQLPGLNLLNTIGGGVTGLIYGIIIVFLISWALRFFGFAISEDMTQSSVLLQFFMDVNPISNVVGM